MNAQVTFSMKKKKDTKTLIGDLEVPEINSKVIGTEVCFLVTIDTYTVYVVCVCISKYSPRWCLDRQFHWFDGRYLHKRNETFFVKQNVDQTKSTIQLK